MSVSRQACGVINIILSTVFYTIVFVPGARIRSVLRQACKLLNIILSTVFCTLYLYQEPELGLY